MYSGDTVLVSLAVHILQETDHGRLTARVLLYVSAASDTVKHSVLIQQLESVGVTSLVLNWFSSYPSDMRSPPTPLTQGIPERSVGDQTTLVLSSHSL